MCTGAEPSITSKQQFCFPVHATLRNRIMVLNVESIHIQMESVYFAFKTYSLKMG